MTILEELKSFEFLDMELNQSLVTEDEEPYSDSSDEYPSKEHRKWCEDPSCPCRSI